jgi:DNA-binding beta-propeller fold protein YncE
MKIFLAVFLSTTLALTCKLHAQDNAPFRLAQTILLSGVKGRIDHLAADLKRQRLFVAALGNNTVEVIDLRAGKQSHRIDGLQEPQGLVYIPEFGKIFVGGGGDGTCKVFDDSTFHLITSVKLDDDADNVRYDAGAKRVYVGYGNGALGSIDVKTHQRLADIKLAGHPESFQLENSGRNIYVNVPSAEQVAVIDRNKQAVIATWPLAGLRANFPMALDEAHQRLFVGTRRPARIAALDTKSGRAVAVIKCGEDADDIFYDAARRRIYVSCGEGVINVFEQRDADHYQELTPIRTAPGARTALWVPEMNRLFLAVPHRDNQAAAVRVYEAQLPLK